jgi:hypothetical protein
MSQPLYFLWVSLAVWIIPRQKVSDLTPGPESDPGTERALAVCEAPKDGVTVRPRPRARLTCVLQAAGIVPRAAILKPAERVEELLLNPRDPRGTEGNRWRVEHGGQNE